MKRLLLLLLCSAAFGQAVRYDLPPVLNSRGVPIANPQISLCTGLAVINGTTCSIQAQSVTDITGATSCPSGSPVTAPNLQAPQGTGVCKATGDSLGNAGFWLTSGSYIYCVTAPSTTGQCYNLTVPVGATSAGVATITGALTAGSGSVITGLTTGKFNNTCNADQQAGADYGAKILACLGGGSANSVDVLVSGGGTVTTPINITGQDDRIIGIGHTAVGLTNGITGSNAACMIKISGTASGITLENFQVLGNGLTGASGNGNGICVVGTGATPSLIYVTKVTISGHKGTGIDGTGASMPSAGLYAFKMIDLYVNGGSSNGNQRGYVLDTLVNNAQISNAQAFQNILTSVQTKGGAGGGDAKIIIGPYNDFEGNGTLTSDLWLSLDSCEACSVWGNWFESNSGEIILASNTTFSSFDFYGNIIIHGANGSTPNTSQALDSAGNVDFDIHNNYFNMQQGMTNIIDINPSTSASIGKRIRNNTFDFAAGALGNLAFSWQGGTQAGPCIFEGNSFGSVANTAFTGPTAVDVGGNTNGCRVTNNACTTSSGTLTNCVKVESGSTNTFVSGTVTSGAGAITNIVSDSGTNTICQGNGCPKPVISTHFNTSGDSITANGIGSFVVTVGTGTATSTGALTLPTAAT